MLHDFPLRYSRLNRDNGYTEEEDRYILWLCREVGFGEWRKMRRRVEKDEEFSFDYFLVSRTEVEIDRRVNVLVREVQRFSDPQYKGRSKTKSKKKEDERKDGGGGEDEAKIKQALAAAAAAQLQQQTLNGAGGLTGTKRKSDSLADASAVKRKR